MKTPEYSTGGFLLFPKLPREIREKIYYYHLEDAYHDPIGVIPGQIIRSSFETGWLSKSYFDVELVMRNRNFDNLFPPICHTNTIIRGEAGPVYLSCCAFLINSLEALDAFKYLLASFPDRKGYKSVRNIKFCLGRAGLGHDCLDIIKELPGLRKICILTCGAAYRKGRELEGKERFSKVFEESVVSFRLQDILDLRNLESITFGADVWLWLRTRTPKLWFELLNCLLNWLKGRLECKGRNVAYSVAFESEEVRVKPWISNWSGEAGAWQEAMGVRLPRHPKCGDVWSRRETEL